MPAQPIFEATVDPARNLVRMRFSGDLTTDAMKSAVARIEALLPSLKPGFAVLADFSRVASMGFESVPFLTKIMDLYRQDHIGLIVRVLPARNKDIGIGILAVVHYRGQVRSVTVETMEEAERALK